MAWILVRAVVVFVVTFSSVSALLWAGSEVQEDSQTLREWRKQKVVAPDTPPAYTNESIETAMAMYGIQVPEDVRRPYFDRKLVDRGLTIKRAWHKDTEVKIGAPAFSSWALLGSTLAHELEVHCRQNFFMISLLDRLGLDGTSIAERQAYKHEIIMADRFGLSKQDRRFILETVHYYYPMDHKTKSSLAARLNISFENMLLAK